MTTSARFSIVSAVYNVGPYLQDFIASIEEQTFDLDRVEVIMVDDGSTDESPEVLRAWAARRPDLVRVVTQENAGQGAARNAGIAAATGEWVTFPDPDDVLGARYLRVVDRFLEANPDTDMIATDRVIWMEATGERTRTHPLRVFFRGNQLIDLADTGLHFHNSAAAAFFSLARIRELGLTFDAAIRPNFEDGHFVGRYLLSRERPQVGFLGKARYNYRKRADGSSTLQTSLMHPGRYTTVFELGYNALIRIAQSERGGIPRWLASLIGYELATYLIAAENPNARFLPNGPEIDALHANVAALLEHPEIRDGLLQVRYPVSRTARLALLHGYDADGWTDDHVTLDQADERTGLVRARYFFVGEPPVERIFNGGTVVEPTFAKTRDLDFLGRALLRERILWVSPDPDLVIETNGDLQHLTAVRHPFDQTLVGRFWVNQQLTDTPQRVKREYEEYWPGEPETPEGRRAQRAAAGRKAEREFANAWVFLDKIHEGNDNAEHLFAFVRREHPEINAYFVVEEGGTTWKRLRRQGFGKRVVAHGSLRWRVLMAHCTELLSSHCELAVFAPPEIVEFTRPTWRFTFLQHGVTKDDMSHWLGRRPIDVLVTTTVAEHESIAGDGNNYPFTAKEVQLTGMPRLDVLLAAAADLDASERNVLLVAPTWRDWLVIPLPRGQQRRELTSSAADSEFGRSWRELLTSPELAEAARSQNLQIIFLPHPNIEPILDELDLPDHVRVATYGETDVQDLFSRTRLLVTDYSSIAFDLAYIDSSIVYYQFDADLVTSGAHSTVKGYFDYRRDGFGPVADTKAEALARISEALGAGPLPVEPYRQRISSSFGLRDGQCRARIVELLLATPPTGRKQHKAPTS